MTPCACSASSRRADPAVTDELVGQLVELPGGAIRVEQPSESAELPDDGGVEWAPLVPYWSVLWRSGVALAREVAAAPVQGMRVVELGCGLGVPSLAAARGGAEVLATDLDPEALELLERNARALGVDLVVAEVDWHRADALVERGPFDFALAADVLYERSAVAPLLDLLPRLAHEAWLADPGRPAADAFLTEAERRWAVKSSEHGVVTVHRLFFPQ